MTGTTCVLADDHPAVLDAVARYLEERGISVVARARDGTDALAKIQSHRPNVAVVDVQMGRVGGLELTRQASSAPKTRTEAVALALRRSLIA